MAQQGFEATFAAWGELRKEQVRWIRDQATQSQIEEMQTPGGGVLNTRKAIAEGFSLGKVGKANKRGVSKKAFGPVRNPGGSGNLPFDSGFLQHSLVPVKGGAFPPTISKPPGDATYKWDDGPTMLAIQNAELGEPITVAYTAIYAMKAHYGGKNRVARLWRDLAAQNWQSHVAEAAAASISVFSGGV